MNYTFDAYFLVALQNPLSLAFILLFGFSPNSTLIITTYGIFPLTSLTS